MIYRIDVLAALLLLLTAVTSCSDDKGVLMASQEKDAHGNAENDKNGPSNSPRQSNLSTLGQVEKKTRELRSSFYNSTDLSSLSSNLQLFSNAGDSEATRLIAKSQQECWMFALNPDGFSRDLQHRVLVRPDIERQLEDSFSRVSQRCSGFRGQSISLEQIRRTLLKAIAQGSIAAEAEFFSREMVANEYEYDAEKQLDLVERVIASKDPEAFAAIAASMGGSSVDRIDALAPYPAGSTTAEAAWLLAACGLGMPCGKNSVFLTSACVGGGIGCTSNSVEDLFMQELLPPAEYKKARQWKTVMTR